MLPQVADSGGGVRRGGKEHVAAKHNHADNGRHLNEREPEFQLAEDFDRRKIDDVDQDKENGDGLPVFTAGKPKLHIYAYRRKLGHAYEHVEHPIVPAGQHAGKIAPVLVRKVAEGTGDGFLGHHFAKLAHD